MAANTLWFGLALLLHAALLFAMPRGAAQITPPKVVLAVSLIDAPMQAAAPQPAAPPKATPPKPRPPKPERPKRTRKTRTVPVQESRIQIPDPVEATEPAEPDPAPASQTVAAVSATPGNGTSTDSNADAAASGPFTAARFDAAYLHNPRPPYPAMSRRLHEEGTVMLRVLVQPDGSAEKVVVKKSSGSVRLDDAARAAVEKWRFVPARQGSKPVADWVIVPITWSLES
ncbi:MAG: energy transducer TonB [Azoarcus sp.]|jgi:protein TonB|nr:energy transducer TonB [Azoarcus sp.]